MPPRARTTRTAPVDDSPFGDNVEDISFVKPETVKDASGSDSKKDSTPPPRYVPGKYKETLEGYYTGIGMLCSRWAPNTAKALLQPYEDNTGSEPTMTTGAEQCAISIDEWAKVNPKVRSILDKITTGGVIMAVATAHAPIAVAAAGELGLFSQIGSLFKSFQKDAQEQEVPTSNNGFHYSNPGAAVA